jgi:hypothetical protein
LITRPPRQRQDSREKGQRLAADLAFAPSALKGSQLLKAVKEKTSKIFLF